MVRSQAWALQPQPAVRAGERDHGKWCLCSFTHCIKKATGHARPKIPLHTGNYACFTDSCSQSLCLTYINHTLNIDPLVCGQTRWVKLLHREGMSWMNPHVRMKEPNGFSRAEREQTLQRSHTFLQEHQYPKQWAMQARLGHLPHHFL